jgi:CubicO group peptidase (beta-lactamase class C family)
MLVDDGALRLDDPLSKFIPAFASVSVKTATGLVAADRPITIRDLLTHLSGVATAAGGPTIPAVAPDDTLATWSYKLASLPLEHQPGTRWAYSNAAGFDLLSRVVEVVSHRRYRDFVEQRILRPLGMNDTGFGIARVPADRLQPIAPGLAKDPRLTAIDYDSGAAGLFGSAADYAKFATMLVGDGTYQNHRFLSAQLLKAMRSNQVGGLYPGMHGHSTSRGIGFGYGVAVVTDPASAGVAVAPGSFGWEGASGGRFWSDPATQCVIVEFGNEKAQIELEQAVHSIGGC